MISFPNCMIGFSHKMKDCLVLIKFVINRDKTKNGYNHVKIKDSLG